MKFKASENLFARYLLGELPEAETDALEVRLLTDEEAIEQMQAAEYELIDGYVRGQLSAAQRTRFETHYLSTPLHVDRVATARRLLKAVDELPNETPSAESSSWWRNFFSAPVLAWSGGLAFVLLGAMAIWLLIERGRLQTQLRAEQLRLQTLEADIAQQRSAIQQMLANNAATPLPANGLVLNDGGELLALDAQGQLRGAKDYNEQQQFWLRQALQSARLPQAPQWMDLRAGQDGLMGSPDNELSFKLKQPLGLALLNAAPAFQWEASPAAESYRVDVYDMNSKLVQTSGKLTETQWQPSQALTTGRMYQWQVTALRQGQETLSPAPPEPPARFAIVAANEAAAITRARQTQPKAHLLLSILYARNGLYADAEQELQSLQKANPDAVSVKQMLAELRRRARQSNKQPAQ
ncbi:MAG: hypothetical protein ACKVZH_11880 [Blastocatellia bacterium]